MKKSKLSEEQMNEKQLRAKPSRKWRTRNMILSGLLLFISLLIAGLTGEVILTLLGHHGAPHSLLGNIHFVEDPILNWRYIPHSEFKMGTVVNTYNGAGFRDVEHATEKLPGIIRIVVVGDSVTEGYGVEWKSVFSSVLQSQLGNQFEVINLAMGGLNTPQEIHLLEVEGLRYTPDLVVLNFVLNDCDFYTEFRAAQRFAAEKDSTIGILNMPINPGLKRLLKSSALIYFVKERLENLVGRLSGKEESNYFVSLWEKTENRQKIIEGFIKLQVLQHEKSFQVLVIIWPLLTDFRHYNFESIHQWVRKEAETRGFSTIDLLESFSKFSYGDLQVTAEDSIHPNELGHKMAVDAFLAWHRARAQSRDTVMDCVQCSYPNS